MKFFILISLIAVSILANKDVEELSTDQYQEIQKLLLLTNLSSELNLKAPTIDVALDVGENDISFYVYTKNDRDGKHVRYNQSGQIGTLSNFNKNKNTVFVVHGWNNNYQSPMVTSIIGSLLNVSDINAIAVEWDGPANKIYTTAFSAVPKVGAYLGDFITNISTNFNYTLDKISLIGHSLGAHICGYAGQQTSGQLHAIVGLDPAAPLYLEISKDHRLSEDDAKYVMAIHTNARFLGVSYRVGAADFWPNGGYVQNGCGIDITGSCSHSRSYQYYAESITNNTFIATECSSYDDYDDGDCDGNKKVAMGGPVIDTSIIGNFYLDTNSQYPYPLGNNSS